MSLNSSAGRTDRWWDSSSLPWQQNELRSKRTERSIEARRRRRRAVRRAEGNVLLTRDVNSMRRRLANPRVGDLDARARADLTRARAGLTRARDEFVDATKFASHDSRPFRVLRSSSLRCDEKRHSTVSPPLRNASGGATKQRRSSQ